VIATSLLYSSWALVLGPVFRAGSTSVLEQAIALAYPLGDVVLVTVVFVVVARIRVGGAPVLLLGAGLVSLAVADTGFAYLTQEGSYRTGVPTDAGWFLGYLLVAAAARRPVTVGITWVGRTSSPSCSSRPPATRSPSGSPSASSRRCARPSPSVAPRSRSGPASASP
jgi:hypothetical protein